jgi:hypothetical protein
MPYLREGIRFFYTLEQKSKIVELAYSEPNNVKPESRYVRGSDSWRMRKILCRCTSLPVLLREVCHKKR